jgi:hypothetical protein
MESSADKSQFTEVINNQRKMSKKQRHAQEELLLSFKDR